MLVGAESLAVYIHCFVHDVHLYEHTYVCTYGPCMYLRLLCLLLTKEFMKHLSVCPKKTIDGANATKEDPLIINPVFAMESCSIGLIVLNADGNKPRQVTAGALIVRTS